MEKATFHAHLNRLREVFPDRELISLKEAAKFCGCDYRTLQANKTFPLKPVGKNSCVALINLARWLAI